MAKKTAAAVKVVTKTKEAKLTIGAVAIAELMKSQDAEKALQAVKKQFPDGNTKMASIYWYASQNGIRLQKAAAEKVVHKVAAPAKKAAKAAPKAAVKVPAKGKVSAKAPVKRKPMTQAEKEAIAGPRRVIIGKAKVSARKPVDAEAEAADKAASSV